MKAFLAHDFTTAGLSPSFLQWVIHSNHLLCHHIKLHKFATKVNILFPASLTVWQHLDSPAHGHFSDRLGVFNRTQGKVVDEKIECRKQISELSKLLEGAVSKFDDHTLVIWTWWLPQVIEVFSLARLTLSSVSVPLTAPFFAIPHTSVRT